MEVLGLEGPAAPAELKRAYHRRLRVTKPDEDPEGFKRLRAAYELLQRAGEAPEAASGAEGASEGAGRQVELHVLGAPLDGMAEEVDLQERIRQLDRAVRFSPERLELWVALVTALVQVEARPAALATVERMARHHPLEAWRLRVSKLPESITSSMLKTPPEGVSLRELADALFVLADQQDFALDVLPVARKLIWSTPPQELEAVVEDLVQVGLRLAAAGYVHDGQQVVRTLTERCPDAVAAQQAMAMEWAAVTDFPIRILQQLAEAILLDDDELVEGMDPVEAEALPGLEEQAPRLNERFFERLDGPAPPVHLRRPVAALVDPEDVIAEGGSYGRYIAPRQLPIGGVLFLLFLLARIISDCGGTQ